MLSTALNKIDSDVLDGSVDSSTEAVRPESVMSVYKNSVEPVEQKQATTMSTFGSFSLAGAEFALSARWIQEVVNEPESYSSLPLAPDYLLGVFNLRGSIVPVIDLRKVFSLDTTQEKDADVRKVAILEYGELCLGLLFDSTGEVFSGNDVEQCLFEATGDSPAEQVIAGVFKMDNGNRIVQILDVNGMLGLDKVPHSKNQASTRFVKSRGERRQCISFQVGESCCAVDIGTIREIVNIGKIDNLLLASGLCMGAMDIRGDTVPIVDASRLLGYTVEPPQDMCDSDSYRVIVLSISDNLVGMLVNSIEEILAFYEDELVEFPVLNEEKREMFQGCVTSKLDKRHTIILDVESMLSGLELAEITRGHSALFHNTNKQDVAKDKGPVERKTIITFSLDQRYALDISDVKEVIDYPSELVEIPNMADHFNGMANLRGELVAVIDSRRLYGMASVEHSARRKVLVYDKDGIKQGLVVDSVDSIVPFTQSDSVKIPEMLYKKSDVAIHKDVLEAVMIKGVGSEETVCILNLDEVAKRANA